MKNKFFQGLVNSSFAIYLLHMPFIGVFDALLNKWMITRILAPIIIIGISFLAITLCKIVARRIKLGTLFNVIMGLRDK